MTAGRHQLKTPDIIDVEVTQDQPRINGAMTVMLDDAAGAEASVRADIFRLGQMVGARQMNQLAVKFLRAADISLFEEISKDKVYKHLPIRFPDGNLRPAENIQEFCKVFFNASYSVMAENRQALEVLGSESYEIAKSLGLKRTQLRLLINLPEDTRSVVEEAMQAGSKSDVVTLIQSLANQLDEAKEKAEELKADVAAKENVLALRAKQIDALHIDLERAKKLPPDEVLAELHRESTAMLNDTRGALIGKFSACVEAIDAHHAAHGGDSAVFLAGLCGQLQADLNALRDRFGIPDVVPAMIPEWVNDPSFAALNKD